MSENKPNPTLKGSIDSFSSVNRHTELQSYKSPIPTLPKTCDLSFFELPI